MTLRYDTISFLSDYGHTDEFVGVVHSVVRSIEPAVAVIDITHDIAPYDVRGGGLALARSAPYLCPGVVLAIVDPGVGTPRRGIAVEVGDGASVLIGPDNGLLAPAVAMCGGATRAVALTNPDYQLEAPGPTFAGRDIFAPAAAHLCAGVPLEALGDLIDPATLLPGLIPIAHHEGDELAAEVLWVDRYGNAQLNLDPDDLAVLGPPEQLTTIRLRFGDQVRAAKVVDTFAAIGAHELGLVVDSYGLLAVVVDQQSAADQHGLGPGTAVHLKLFEEEDAADVIMGVTTAVTLSPRRKD